MDAVFKLWSNDKMKTFNSEHEAHSFANQMDIFDYVVLRLIADEDDSIIIQIKDEEEGWTGTGFYLVRFEDGDWGLTEDFNSGTTFKTPNKALKYFVRTMRDNAIAEQAGEKRINSPFDVYSPSELGLTIKY